MNQYSCFFSHADGEVSDFLIIEADSDARVRMQADNILRGQSSYISVEIYEDDRLLGRIERAA